MTALSSARAIALPSLLAIRLLAPLTAAAQTVPPTLLDCSTQTDESQRLHCYDREIARLRASPPAPSSALPPPRALPPPDPKDPAAIDRFGLTSELQHQRQEEGRAPKELEQIGAKVVSVHYKPRGDIVVVLDNGQTWEQAEYDGDVSLRVGDSVTIKAGALSAYYLKPRAGRIVRVRRIH